MHLERGKLNMDRWSDGISTIPDDSNTLTHQSTVTNNAPRGPLYGIFKIPPFLPSKGNIVTPANRQSTLRPPAGNAA